MKRLASVVVALILPTVCAFAAAPEAVPVTSPAGGSGASQKVSLTGPAGVKAFIREEFSPLFER